MISQLLIIDSSIVVLDRLASYREISQALGGVHIEVDFNNPICFNPFYGPLDEEHKARSTSLINVLAADNQVLTTVQLGVISEAVGILFEKEWAKEPTMSDLVVILRQGNPNWGEHGHDIALMLAPFNGQGRFAGFIDGQNQFALNPRLTVFELSSLKDSPQLQTAIGLSLMSILAAYFGDPSRIAQRKFLFNDEVWSLLQHEMTAKVLIEIARTFRKVRTSAVFISQNPRDFLTPVGRDISDLCAVRYMLSMDHTVIEDMRPAYDLQPQEVAALKGLTIRKGVGFREGYIRLPQQQGGIVRIKTDDFTRWALEQEDVRVKVEINRLMDERKLSMAEAIDAYAETRSHV